MTQVARASSVWAGMKRLQLTLILRDAQAATMTAQTFTRGPVFVGRQHGNQVRLDAGIVSRRHGAFLFSKDGVQYIDYASANGSYLDGIRVEANRPIDIRDSSVITIVPFQIVASLHLVDARRLSNNPNASTSVETILWQSADATFVVSGRTDRARRAREARSRRRRGAAARGRQPDRADALAAAVGVVVRRDGRSAARSGGRRRAVRRAA